MPVSDFLDHLRYQKRYSEHTLKAYGQDLQEFSGFLSEKKELPVDDPGIWKEVTHHYIREWILEMMNDNLSAKTVNRKLSSLKSFFKYLLRQGLVEGNPAARITAPKTRKTLVRVVPEEDMDHLIDDLVFEDDQWGITSRMIFLTFYHTGMRQAELIGLRITDVDLDQDRLKVTGKRNKQRYIPLTPSLKQNLVSYIELRNTWTAEPGAGDHLFITQKGRALYPRLVYQLIHDILERSSGTEKKSPHVLRHSFATHMLNHGADLNSIKEILGHANLSATQVYTHNSIDELKRVYGRSHPRNQ